MKNSCCLLFFFACSVLTQAQQIQIRIVDAKSLKPVTNDCAWISLGGWQTVNDMNFINPNQLYVPVDKSGTVRVEVDMKSSTAQVVGRARSCGPKAPTPLRGPSPFQDKRMQLAVQSSSKWDCQKASVVDMPPVYSLEQIFNAGVVSENTCTRVRPRARPGELVIVVRDWTAKEKQENPEL